MYPLDSAIQTQSIQANSPWNTDIGSYNSDNP